LEATLQLLCQHPAAADLSDRFLTELGLVKHVFEVPVAFVRASTEAATKEASTADSLPAAGADDPLFVDDVATLDNGWPAKAELPSHLRFFACAPLLAAGSKAPLGCL
jgi:hypothetical protein